INHDDELRAAAGAHCVEAIADNGRSRVAEARFAISPEQLGPVGWPGLQEAGFLGNIRACRPLPLRPIIGINTKRGNQDKKSDNPPWLHGFTSPYKDKSVSRNDCMRQHPIAKGEEDRGVSVPP